MLDGFPFQGPEGAARAARPVPRHRVSRRVDDETLRREELARQQLKAWYAKRRYGDILAHLPNHPAWLDKYRDQLDQEDRKHLALIREGCRQRFGCDLTPEVLPALTSFFEAWAPGPRDVLWCADVLTLGEMAGLLKPAPPAAGAQPAGSKSAFVLLPEDISILAVLYHAQRAMTYPQIARKSVTVSSECRKRGDDSLIPVSASVLRVRVPILLEQQLVTRPPDKSGKPTQRKGIGITPQGRELLATVLPNTTLKQL
jgi:hypothetical protein